MHILDSETGQFISREHQRVAEVINEYDPTLQLVWIPPEKRALDENFPFAILHSPGGDTAPYIARKVREQDMNETLVAWLFANDQLKNPHDLNEYQNLQDAARRTLNEKVIADARAEKFDFIKTVLAGKNYFRHDGKVYS